MIEIFEPQIFNKDKLICGVTLRSIENYPVTGFTCGNDDYYGSDLVHFHRQELANQLGFSPNNLKFQKQVHGDTTRIINEFALEDESDAMITSNKGLILCVKVADCAAILIHDRSNDIIAAVHSGWKGTKLDICSKVILKMAQEFNSKPEDLCAFISPCASGDNYEVGMEFMDYFPKYVYQSDGKYYFDNAAAIRGQLINAGLKSNDIEVSGICSISDLRCHSYRRDKEKAGRMTAFIGLI